MSLKPNKPHYNKSQRWVALINSLNRSITKDDNATPSTNPNANNAMPPKTYKTWETILVFIYDNETESLRWCPAYVVGHHTNKAGQNCFSMEVLKWRNRPDAGYIWEVKEEDTQTMTEFRPIKRWTNEQMMTSAENDEDTTKSWNL